MANKLNFYETWDLKSFFGVIAILLVLSIIAVIFYSFPSFSNNSKLSKYDAEITGMLISADEQVLIRQTIVGSKPMIDHFTVKFTYEVGEQTYENTDVVSGTIRNIDKIKRILSSTNKSIRVKYLSDEPAKSVVDLTNQ